MTAFMLSRRALAAEIGTTQRELRRLERLGIGPKPIYLGPKSPRYTAAMRAEFEGLKAEALAGAPAEVSL